MKALLQRLTGSSVRLLLIVLSVWVLCLLPSEAATIVVNPRDDLAATITTAGDGDLILVNPGTYPPLSLKGIKRSNYVTVKRNGDGLVVIRGKYYTLRLVECSYLIFDGIRIADGGINVTIETCDHIIVRNCEVTNAEQEGLEVRINSQFVDVINCRIWNTGTRASKYGEGIYIGTADGRAKDYTRRVWIENCEIFDCGNGEAINVKGDVMESTIRGCNIHDIAPGTADQYNEGAISLEAVGDTTNVVRRDNYVENNRVTRVTGGRFNRGIVVFGSGNTVRNNVISECEGAGLLGHTFHDQPSLVTYVHGNVITNCRPDEQLEGTINLSRTDRPNPYSPQLVETAAADNSAR